MTVGSALARRPGSSAASVSPAPSEAASHVPTYVNLYKSNASTKPATVSGVFSGSASGFGALTSRRGGVRSNASEAGTLTAPGTPPVTASPLSRLSLSQIATASGMNELIDGVAARHGPGARLVGERFVLPDGQILDPISAQHMFRMAGPIDMVEPPRLVATAVHDLPPMLPGAHVPQVEPFVPPPPIGGEPRGPVIYRGDTLAPSVSAFRPGMPREFAPVGHGRGPEAELYSTYGHRPPIAVAGALASYLPCRDLSPVTLEVYGPDGSPEVGKAIAYALQLTGMSPGLRVGARERIPAARWASWARRHIPEGGDRSARSVVAMAFPLLNVVVRGL